MKSLQESIMDIDKTSADTMHEVEDVVLWKHGARLREFIVYAELADGVPLSDFFDVKRLDQLTKNIDMPGWGSRGIAGKYLHRLFPVQKLTDPLYKNCNMNEFVKYFLNMNINKVTNDIWGPEPYLRQYAAEIIGNPYVLVSPELYSGGPSNWDLFIMYTLKKPDHNWPNGKPLMKVVISIPKKELHP